jgi:hypothetical protein
VLLAVAVLIFYACLLLFRRKDRLPPAYAVLAIIAILTPVLSLRLNSSARFMATVWPFAWILGNRRSAWFELVGLAGAGALFAIYGVLNFTQALAP